jgi:hypothetical protein
VVKRASRAGFDMKADELMVVLKQGDAETDRETIKC